MSLGTNLSKTGVNIRINYLKIDLLAIFLSQKPLFFQF